MKKIVYATLAAAAVFASIGGASAQSAQHLMSYNGVSLNTGGASSGYNQTIASFDSYK
jgi:hypothetical protein